MSRACTTSDCARRVHSTLKFIYSAWTCASGPEGVLAGLPLGALVPGGVAEGDGVIGVCSGWSSVWVDEGRLQTLGYCNLH